MSETISGFFSGGGKSVKFPNVGSKVDGVITKVHPPEPQTDFESRQPIPGKLQMRIEMDVDEVDPSTPEDDGSRTLYVKGWMTGAITEALRKVGLKEPVPGARLSVVRIEDGPPNRPGLQGPHRFSAVYTPGMFFKEKPAEQPAASTNGAAAVPTEPPPGIDAEAWKTMPPEAKQAIANVTAAGAAKAQ